MQMGKYNTFSYGSEGLKDITAKTCMLQYVHFHMVVKGPSAFVWWQIALMIILIGLNDKLNI